MSTAHPLPFPASRYDVEIVEQSGRFSLDIGGMVYADVGGAEDVRALAYRLLQVASYVDGGPDPYFDTFEIGPKTVAKAAAKG